MSGSELEEQLQEYWKLSEGVGQKLAECKQTAESLQEDLQAAKEAIIASLQNSPVAKKKMQDDPMEDSVEGQGYDRSEPRSPKEEEPHPAHDDDSVKKIEEEVKSLLRNHSQPHPS